MKFEINYFIIVNCEIKTSPIKAGLQTFHADKKLLFFNNVT